MEKRSFVSIDFELMTPELTSACAVGLVKVVDNVILQKFYSLIKPISDDRTERNTFVHGISDEMVEHAPTWGELFPLIEDFFESRFIACHQESTDINILSRINSYYGISIGSYQIIDTYALTGQSLSDACSRMGIDMGVHHDALCDASACAELTLAFSGVKVVKPTYVKISKSGQEARKLESDTKQPLAASEVENPNTPFFLKKVVITGLLDSFPIREELASLLKRYGADINTSISRKTDIVIVGDGCGPSKMKKITELKTQGIDIHVMYEPEFLEIIEKYNIK